MREREELKKELEEAGGLSKKKKEKKKGKKRKMKLWVKIVIMVIFTGGLVYAGVGLYQRHEDNKKLDKMSKEIEKDIEIEEREGEGELVNPPEDKNSDYWRYIKVPFYNVDFSKLKEKNKDTVGFIHMEQTNINYPVVSSGDNEYYLTHAYDKSKNSAGWVFLDYRNSLSDLSDNTVIYGHGRVNGTVFGSLKKTLEKGWQSNKDNYIIWLSTEKENMVWQIFSVYTVQSEEYYIKANFNTDEEKEAWAQEMKKRNTAPQSAEVSAKDHFLTLSTCKNNLGTRIVVQAKLIKRQAK